MTREKLQQVLDLAYKLKAVIAIVAKNNTRIFINFNNEDYNDTFIEDNVKVPCLYVWNTTLNHWDSITVDGIDYVKLY